MSVDDLSAFGGKGGSWMAGIKAVRVFEPFCECCIVVVVNVSESLRDVGVEPASLYCQE